MSMRITQRLKPRLSHVVALPATNDPEHTHWCFRRHASHLPAAGEMALFDRSWYNREGVEMTMVFGSMPELARMLVRSGIKLVKYWFSITDEEQHLRFS